MSSQLWGVVLGSLLTGVVALLVGMMNNMANDRRQTRQLAHDVDRESTKQRRERLEELYVLTALWTTTLNQLALTGLRLSLGKLSHSQFQDLQISIGKESGAQPPRMNMLMGIYASEAVRLQYAEVKSAQEAYMAKLFVVERIATGQTVLDVDRIGYPEFQDLARSVDREGRRLLDQIAAQALA